MVPDQALTIWWRMVGTDKYYSAVRVMATGPKFAERFRRQAPS
jgi:hypothetical protein